MTLEKHKFFLKTLKFFCEEICVSLCIYDSEVVFKSLSISVIPKWILSVFYCSLKLICHFFWHP